MKPNLILAAALCACPAALAAAPAPKDWTVMVYVNGKNDLETFAVDDMNEMERAGSTDRVNVVAEFGRMAGYSEEEGDWKGVRRYLVLRDSSPYEITSPVLQDLGKKDMGDWRELEDFGRWAMANYPARHYMLIVWNHGSGWRGPRPPAGRGISYDYETGGHINTPQLALALAGMGRVDVYASDACLMQMAEVAYELKDRAEYIVGSEETEPVAGYPYDALVGGLTARPEMTPLELARLTADVYAEYYRKKNLPSTCSAVRAAAMEGLRKKADAFAAALTASGEKAAFRAARERALRFATEDNADLYDLAALAGGYSSDAAVKAAAADLTSFLAGEAVVYSRYTEYSEPDDPYTPWKAGARGDRGYSSAHGLAVYAPAGAAEPSYRGLAWGRDSAWPAFIDWYSAK